MRLRRCGIVAPLFFLMIVSTIEAAELRLIRICPDKSCDIAYLYIIGKIEPGDAERVRQTIRNYGPGIEALMLRSPGGSMYDSMQIGTLASDLMLNTFAPPAPNYCANEDTRWGITNAPCTCLSGCFLIWMGGVNRYGTVVGMHRPWDTTGNMGRMAYEEAAAQYNRWINELNTYLTSMELPPAFFSTFIATVKSGNMRMLTGSELLQLNHNPSKTEWLTNRCGQWTAQENEELGNLNAAQYHGRPHNSTRRQQLVAKYSASQTCQTETQRAARKEAFTKVF
jgi:hypothetical protein